MFANNNMISLRQMRRLLTFDMLGIGCLFLPPVLAGRCGIWGVWCIVTGALMAFIYILLLEKALEIMDKDLLTYINSRIISGLLAIIMTVFSSVCLHRFVDVIKLSLLPEEPFWEIAIILVLISMYAISGGMESRARIYEILFYFILIPLVVMILAAASDIKPQYLLDYAYGDAWIFGIESFALGSLASFSVFSVLFFLLFFPGRVADGNSYNIAKNAAVSLGTVTTIIIFLYLVLVGNFGTSALARMKIPVISLMNTVQINGSFFKRTDALMCGIWFFTMLAIVNMNIYYSGKSLEKTLGKPIKYGFAVTGAACWIMAMTINAQEEIMEKIIRIAGIIGVPLILLIPMIIFFKGCGSKELENRCFPMLMVVDEKDSQVMVSYVFPKSREQISIAPSYASDFKGAKEKHDRTLSKHPDFNHIKVILLSTQIVQDKKRYEEILDYSFDTETFPRNTYVCVTGEVEEVLEAGDNLSADLGTYIEELLENHPLKVGNPPATIGMLMDDNINKIMKPKVPYLSVVDGTICWEKLYSIE